METPDYLTPNFRLHEFEQSVTASLKGYDNTVPQMAWGTLRHLCEAFLQPLRDRVKTPLVISSGYRCRDLNREVGGSETSWHLTGCAADFHPLDRDKRAEIIQLARLAREQWEVWKKDPAAGEQPAVQFTEFIVYPTFFHVAVAHFRLQIIVLQLNRSRNIHLKSVSLKSASLKKKSEVLSEVCQSKKEVCQSKKVCFFP